MEAFFSKRTQDETKSEGAQNISCPMRPAQTILLQYEIIGLILLGCQVVNLWMDPSDLLLLKPVSSHKLDSPVVRTLVVQVLPSLRGFVSH